VLELPADRVWYVGDTPGIDVVGARRAGIRPFLLDPLDLHHGAGFDRVGSLAELADRLRASRDAVDPAHRFNLASARAAARQDMAAIWVGHFLASRGSDNEILAAALAQRQHWWHGPARVPLTALVRLAGPEDDVECPIDPASWEHDVEAMEESIEHGWEPPPLLAQWRDGALILQDGNHRYEALLRAGASHAWVLIWFDNPSDRDAFAARTGRPVSGVE
jgi:hypothetical protein